MRLRGPSQVDQPSRAQWLYDTTTIILVPDASDEPIHARSNHDNAFAFDSPEKNFAADYANGKGQH
jgi:hypothetical protein